MRACVVIPVFNERDQLESSTQMLMTAASGWKHASIEFVIANNASTDGTNEIAENLASTFSNVRHEYLDLKGRGRALRLSWVNSDADILAYMDVDLSTDIAFFPALIEPLASGAADLSVGSRLLRPELTARGWKREFISRSYNRLLRLLFAPSFSDAQCGFKAITKAAAKELLPLVEDQNWFFDTELLLLADHLGFRIHDLPVRWKDDSDSRVRIIPTIIQDLKGVARMKRRLRQLPRGTALRTAHAT